MGREELDRTHRVGKPKVAEENDENLLLPRAMNMKLRGHDTKMKIVKTHRNLQGSNIFINEDLTKLNHKFLMYVRNKSTDGVAVYSMAGTVMTQSSGSNRVYRIKKKDDLVKYGLEDSAPEKTENAEQANLTLCFLLIYYLYLFVLILVLFALILMVLVQQ